MKSDLVDEGEPPNHSPSRGDAAVRTVVAGSGRAPGAAQVYEESPLEEVRGTVRLQWDAMDAWFEEDEEVYTHARDPYTRVDILASTRLVEVRVEGVTVANSSSPRMLLETGLPVRYYLPQTDIRMDLLELTDTVTHCPYKGRAQTWSVTADDAVHSDLAWGYPAPLPESQKVAGLIAFYNEKVDILIDGIPQDRPKTKFG